MTNTTLDGTGAAYVIAGGTTRTVAAGNTLTLLGEIANAGTIFLDSTGSDVAHGVDLDIGAPGVTLSGGGTVQLSILAGGEASPDNLITATFGPAGTVYGFVNVDNVITGAGALNLTIWR